MAFIQPCFIRKNTPELRKTLEALGYKASFGNINNDSIATSSITNTYSCISMSIFDNENPHINWKANGKRIDCGDNEDLFLALVSMTDNEHGLCDYYIVTEDSIRYEKGSLHRALPISSVIHPSCYRKATVEEIIEHFKKD